MSSIFGTTGPVIDRTGPLGAFPKGPKAAPEPSGEGLIVALSSIAGLSSPRVLGDPFYFQVAPLNQMPQDYTWQWDDYQTVDAGMKSNPQSPALDSFSFESLFLDDDTAYGFTQVTNQHVLTLLRALKAIGDSMRPFQLQFGQPRLWGVWDVVSAVTMRTLHVEERAGEVDARYFTVSFTEYNGAGTLNPVPPPPLPSRARSGLGPNVKVTQPGIIATLNSANLPDNLKSLALLSKYYYGDPTRWRAIAKASGLTGTSPNTDLRTTVGQQRPPVAIVIPELN